MPEAHVASKIMRPGHPDCSSSGRRESELAEHIHSRCENVLELTSQNENGLRLARKIYSQRRLCSAARAAK